MFEKGGYVVYGTTGVCRVEEITALNMKGAAEDRMYYVLRPCFQNGSTIFTPVDNEKTKIRRVMTKKEADALVKKIPEIEELWEKNDKEREKQYKEAIRSCDPGEWVRIIKTSYQRGRQRMAQGKRATTVDERYFHAAEDHLYAELAVAFDMPKEEVKAYIMEKMN